MKKTKNFIYPADINPIGLFKYSTLLEFIGSPRVLVHKNDSASTQRGDLFDWSGNIEYTPVRVLEMSSTPFCNPNSIWVEISGDRISEQFRIWFDATKSEEKLKEGKLVREYIIHYESTRK